MSEPIAVRCYVSGRVQGVFFRASTRAKAIELAVHGYARNLPDGRVEVLAVGAPSAVEALCQWLWTGPPSARVDKVAMETVPLTELRDVPNGFSTA